MDIGATPDRAPQQQLQGPWLHSFMRLSKAIMLLKRSFVYPVLPVR